MDWNGLEEFRKTLPEYRRYERFRFLVAQWDIVRALYLIDKSQRETCKLLLSNAPNFYGFEHPERSLFHFDHQAHNDERVDITRPVLLALINTGEGQTDHLVIDGLHRIYKAWKLGYGSIPCYVLQPEEEKACRC